MNANVNTDILFEEMAGKEGNLGIIILNRPHALNSLNHAMIKAMQTQLQRWAAAPHIKAVIIRAIEGRAFCAGGDLRLIYAHKQDNTNALSFFYDEYQLNRYIFNYPKPYIALLDGITMGGGVGISIHGSHRIATENLLFAMPETGIGFFPDIGGSYFLPRLSGQFGSYLGLTGAKLSSDECFFLRIVQHKVLSKSLPQLINALANSSFVGSGHATVTQVIDEFKAACHAPLLMEQERMIEDCFSLKTVEDILSALQETDNAICLDAATAILKKSPTSLKVTLLALQAGRALDFDHCMRQEYRLTNRFLQGQDFLEGIRAFIIDKDQAPKWQPSSLAGVKESDIEKYFLPLAADLF